MESVLRPRLARTTPRARFGSIKFLLGGLLILGAMGYVSFTSFQSNTVYYYTLREFQAQQAQLRGQTVRVNGPLDQSSIDLDQKTMTLKFNLKEQDVILPVVYRGVVPDTLKSGESVVAEGHVDSSGVFQADTILVKCPSKYEQSTNAAQ